MAKETCFLKSRLCLDTSTCKASTSWNLTKNVLLWFRGRVMFWHFVKSRFVVVLIKSRATLAVSHGLSNEMLNNLSWWWWWAIRRSDATTINQILTRYVKFTQHDQQLANFDETLQTAWRGVNDLSLGGSIVIHVNRELHRVKSQYQNFTPTHFDWARDNDLWFDLLAVMMSCARRCQRK